MINSEILIKARELCKNHKTWNILEDNNYVIIKCADLFTCFLSNAFEFKSRKVILSAHMILHDKTYNLSKIQFWNPNIMESDDMILNKIFNDLYNIEKSHVYYINIS
jgi:hypothetical protein